MRLLFKQAAFFIIAFISFSPAFSQDFSVKDTFQDLKHRSRVFGSDKYYRLYLPAGYHTSGDRYPVIYFFHGWGGRHYKDDNALLAYTKIKTLVDKYQVILVMWDGNMDGIEPRPYNVGNHQDVKYQVQMKDYFPELVHFIDSTCRTYTDRNHRGIIGFSMGGFMSLFLGGKYPHMVNSVVSFAGSPEFFVGYPDNHTLYPVRYTFKNLAGVNLQMHNGDSDILYYLNDEVYQGALWEGFPLEYRKFHGGHMVDKPGETKVFDMAMNFTATSFKNPPAVPQSFTHFDIYNEFNIWDYQVKSNKTKPGYIILRNAGNSGFGIYTQKWLPLSPSLDHTEIAITTPPVYQPGWKYNIVKYSRESGKISNSVITGDPYGRLNFHAGGKGEEYGIYSAGDKPHFIFLDYEIGNGQKYLSTVQSNPMLIKLLNRGGVSKKASTIRVVLKTSDPSIHMTDTVFYIQTGSADRIVNLPPLNIRCNKQPPVHANPAEIKFYLHASSGNEQWIDDFVVPAMFDAPEFQNIKTDDGRIIRDTALGNGNANGIAEAGERIMIYEGSHRLRLFTEDPYIIRKDEQLADEVLPAIWPDGYTMSSVIHISPDCPDGHIIECLAGYETKSYNPIERKVIWGKVKILVKK